MSSENERLTIILTREDKELLLSLGKEHKFARQKKGKKEVNISKTNSFVLQQYPILLQKIRDLENNKDTSLNGGTTLSESEMPSKEECACEGCSWYDGWDSKRNIPKCTMPPSSLPIDKRFLSRTIGNICQRMQQEQIQLQTTLGKTVTRINLGIVLAMAKQMNTVNAELEAINKERNYLTTEIARVNRDLSSTTISQRSSMSGVNALRKNLASKQLEIQTLTKQVETLENKIAEYMNYDLKIQCPQIGELIWLFKECLPCMKKNDCWKNCSSYQKFLID